MRINYKLLLLLPVFSFGFPAQVSAGGVFSFSEGTRAAQATFIQDGGMLRITLENTSAFDVLNPSDVLTGVFFDIADLGSATLTPSSAFLDTGGFIRFSGDDSDWGDSGDDSDDWGDDDGIGGEYGFRSDLLSIMPDAGMVISAVGLGDLIGPNDLFPGENLAGPHSGSPGGIDFGLVSLFDDPLTGNSPVTGKSPLVAGGVVFELAGLPDDFVLGDGVSGVQFNYGSGLNAVPEPATLVLMVVGAILIVMPRRKRFSAGP